MGVTAGAGAPVGAEVLTAATVLTMDPRRPTAEAVGVRDGRIAAVGTAGEVRARMGPDADPVDLGGGALLPGFIDAHHHYCMAAFDRRMPDLHLPPGSTMAQVLGLLEQAARDAPGPWVRAGGYDPAKLREGRAPTREELDEVCPDRPLLVVAYSWHDGALNSRGLTEMGWERPGTDPDNGHVARDRRGRPTGEVIEGALFLAEARSREALLPTAAESWLAECQAHGEALLAAGITRVGDAAVSPSFERLYERAAAEGRLPVTVHRMPVASATFLAPRLDGDPTGSGPAQVPIGPAKLFIDGAERCALCLSVGQVARMVARVLRSAAGAGGLARLRAASGRTQMRLGRDRHLHHGYLFWQQEVLDEAVGRAAQRGFQVAQHAVGNEAIDVALRALERRGSRLGELPGRPRLEHAIFADPRLARRMADAGAIAVVQPYFLYDHLGDTFELLAPPPPIGGLPLRTMLDCGVRLAGSSDYPVSHYDVPAALRAAVTRRSRGGHVPQPEEAIGVEEALRAYTAGSALALGVEDEAGTIAEGKRADLVVLSADPRSVDPDRLHELSVLRTYVGGRLAHSVSPST